MSQTIRGYRATTERSRGWLRYMYRKATTPDNWDKDGEPHAHWDGISGEPRRSWHRFDLQDSAQPVAIMADITPAWREVYGTILDELVVRFTGYWAAKDWLDQIGDDPRREHYPEEWYETLIPPTLRGKYDVPGWTANGVDPWGLQMDPISADGNLFYKGFFLVNLGLHLYVTGDEKWNEQFEVARGGDGPYSWTHSRIAEFLAHQWSGRPEGCHCENTKIWPL